MCFNFGYAGKGPKIDPKKYIYTYTEYICILSTFRFFPTQFTRFITFGCMLFVGFKKEIFLKHFFFGGRERERERHTYKVNVVYIYICFIG